jgi:hypothetical protein
MKPDEYDELVAKAAAAVERLLTLPGESYPSSDVIARTVFEALGWRRPVSTAPVYYQDVQTLDGHVARHLYNEDRCYVGTHDPDFFQGHLEPYDPGPPPPPPPEVVEDAIVWIEGGTRRP